MNEQFINFRPKRRWGGEVVIFVIFLVILVCFDEEFEVYSAGESILNIQIQLFLFSDSFRRYFGVSHE